jgi:hypothetical protein
MKIVKLTKKMLALDPVDLLKKLGACDSHTAFPNHVYFSKADYKTLKSNVRKLAKKQFMGYSKKYIDNVVGFEMLNYGPNSSLEDAIKPGHALIDEVGIGKEIVYGRDKK